MKLPDTTTFLGDPWTPRFLLWLIPGAALVTALLAIRRYDANLLSAVPVVVASLLAALAFEKTLQQAADAKPPFGLLIASLGIAVMGLVLFGLDSGFIGWITVLLPFALFMAVPRVSGMIRHVMIFPLMFMCVPLAVASIMGVPKAGGFPGAFALLLTMVLNMTRDIELRTASPASAEDHPPVHAEHRLTLAKISMIFFLFGVVALWPWLGKMYGSVYFWVLILGVLMPATLYWGRLRQPRHETSYEALIRFNRLSPYLGMVMLIAIALG